MWWLLLLVLLAACGAEDRGGGGDLPVTHEDAGPPVDAGTEAHDAGVDGGVQDAGTQWDEHDAGASWVGCYEDDDCNTDGASGMECLVFELRGTCRARPDAGPVDTWPVDAGVDAGPGDSGPADAGAVDAGATACDGDEDCSTDARCFAPRGECLLRCNVPANFCLCPGNRACIDQGTGTPLGTFACLNGIPGLCL